MRIFSQQEQAGNDVVNINHFSFLTDVSKDLDFLILQGQPDQKILDSVLGMAHLMPRTIGVSQAQRGYPEAADLLVKQMIPFHSLFASRINIFGIGRRIFGDGNGQGLAELGPGADIDDPGLRIMMAQGLQKENVLSKRNLSDGVIGIGGANGTIVVCSIMRALPYLVPKIMVSTVAGTAAVQWYVGESDIAMYPSIGDVALNRITKSVMENAALAVAAAAKNWAAKRGQKIENAPLVAVSSFGGTSGCVDRVSERLEALGYEVILFHASGVGGKSLERLAASGELVGVIDVTTHELADLIVDGVFSAGQGRLTGAGAAGLPQVIVPGAIDHSNFWVGQVPERYRARDFFRYNAQNMLMRTSAEEFEALGGEFAKRINAAKGPLRVLVPLEGFSEHTRRRAHDLEGNDRGLWKRPEDYRIFANSLKKQVKAARIDELMLHVNDIAFADACVDAFVEIAQRPCDNT